MEHKERKTASYNQLFKVVQTGQRIPKKVLLSVLDAAYKELNKDQVGGIFLLIQKMLIAKQRGENITAVFKDFNEEGIIRSSKS